MERRVGTELELEVEADLILGPGTGPGTGGTGNIVQAGRVRIESGVRGGRDGGTGAGR